MKSIKDTQSLLILCSGKITSECIDMMYLNKSVIIHIGLFFLLLNIILWDIFNKTVVFLFLFFWRVGLVREKFGDITTLPEKQQLYMTILDRSIN